jgi:ATP-dependent helicase HrpB
MEKAMEPSGEGTGRLDETALRRAIMTGYPDRVARRRSSQSPRFLLSTGTGAVQSPQSGVRDAEFIVALDLQGAGGTEMESRIRLASAIEKEWLQPTAIELEQRLDERGVVRAAEAVMYDAIELERRPRLPDPETAAGLIAAAWLSRPRTESERNLLSRIRYAEIDVDLRRLLAEAASGKRAVDEIVLADALPWDLLRRVDRDAPEALLLPSGRHARLKYSDDGSVSASVKLQELFGLAETPRIGSRREPLVLELLAPNGRPVQVTRDLRSFWDRTYKEVRKELRGRYPKHPWPEDPWTAPPTHRTRPNR